MKRDITIVQIYEGVDLRKGEDALGKFALDNGYDVRGFMQGQVLLFINRKSTLVKSVANRGMIREVIPNRKGVLNKTQIVKAIGKGLGLNFGVSREYFKVEEKKERRKAIKQKT